MSDAAAEVERLKGGRDALTAELLAALEQAACIPALIAMAGDEALLAAPEPEGWGPLFAIRILGRLAAVDAVPTLVRILEGAEEDDQASAEAAQALRRIGPDALPALAQFLRTTANPHGRGMALEVVSNLSMEYSGGEAFDEVRRALEELLVYSEDAGLRPLLVEYLGDLANPESIDVLLLSLTSPNLTAREYEAVRDVLERMGTVCPDVYFDVTGKGYPLDDEKEPLCARCGVRMIIQEAGDLRHPDPTCTADVGAATNAAMGSEPGG